MPVLKMLAIVRQYRHWSQVRLAKELDVHAFTVQRWEYEWNEPRPATRAKLYQLYKAHRPEIREERRKHLMALKKKMSPAELKAFRQKNMAKARAARTAKVEEREKRKRPPAKDEEDWGEADESWDEEEETDDPEKDEWEEESEEEEAPAPKKGKARKPLEKPVEEDEDEEEEETEEEDEDDSWEDDDEESEDEDEEAEEEAEEGEPTEPQKKKSPQTAERVGFKQHFQTLCILWGMYQQGKVEKDTKGMRKYKANAKVEWDRLFDKAFD